MSIPFVALIGSCVGALGTGAVVLGGAVAGVSLGPVTSVSPPTPTTAAAPILTPAAAAAARWAAGTCPGLDWTLLAGAALIDPTTEGDLTDIATRLCLLTPSARPLALASLLSGAVRGGIALVVAQSLHDDPALSVAAATAITYAAANLGVPYRWGGTGPGGFDCSGLAQASYRAAHVQLPRVAQDQFDAGPRLPAGSAPLPGDLVFYGSEPLDVTHVGLFIGGGDMIDAPHTGAFVRIEPAPTTPASMFGPDSYVGATRPWA
ncbi:MAG TPA: C40 family peptidase [Acidimicrobiales bacterium]|nr:C40 family peptidase [Acidimicrobiales bacterium]